MNIDTFQGYIQYRGKEHIFVFNNYILNIIPNSFSGLLECQSTWIFESLTERNKKGWINQLQLEGYLLDGSSVTFCIQDNPGLKDGIFSYKVKWLYVDCLNSDHSYRIKGINFLSQEIDCLYNTKKYVTDDFSLKNGSYKEYQVNIHPSKPVLLGNFKYSNYGVKIFGDMSFRNKYCSKERLEIWSSLSLELSRETVDLDKIYRLSLLQLNVIKLLTYRTNNSFELIETYIYDERKRKIITGKFYFNHSCELEKDYENIQHLISFENILNVGPLYKAILEDKIYLAHICRNDKERLIYSPSRILGIMIAFERIFSWQYGKSKVRSEKYISLLERLECYLNEHYDDICGDKYSRKYFNKIKRRLREPQVSYGDYLSYVIKEIPLCKRYITNLYNVKNVNKIVNDISERISKFRNDMAHGNMDVEILIEHTRDLKLLEMVIYTMILNYLGLSDEDIIKKVVWLFKIKSF